MGVRAEESGTGSAPLVFGRCSLHDEVASGGMATVHLGRVRDAAGVRTVAIKRMYRQYAREAEFAAMALDEGRIAARIRHPNVVRTFDIVTEENELLLVMEYVHGESLASLLKVTREKNRSVPIPIGVAIVAAALHGLHAAHTTTDEHGRPLELVHRDVSPHNILVGRDGIVRVIDFGIAKAAGRLQGTTRTGQRKGKLAYMSPEQLHGKVSYATDIYAASIVLWETLTNERCFGDLEEAQLFGMILAGSIQNPSAVNPKIDRALDDIVMRGLDPDPGRRFASAEEMARALEAIHPIDPARIAAWVEELAGPRLDARAARIAEIERLPFGGANGEKRLFSPKIVAIGGAALVGVVGGAALLLRPPARAETPVAPEIAVTTTASVAATRPPIPAVDEPRPPTTIAESAAPAPSPKPRVARPAPPSCNPPYTVDSDGIKHYKAGCFK